MGKTSENLRAALGEDREIRRLEAERDALQAKAETDREARDAQEDAELADAIAAEEAEAAELQRRAVEEPPGSLRWAVRQTSDRGEATIPPDVLEAMSADALRELEGLGNGVLDPNAKTPYQAALERFGTEQLARRV